MKIKFYENKIKTRTSLKECVEFAFMDEEVCRGDSNRKLIGFYKKDCPNIKSPDAIYKQLLSDEGKWKKETEYEYEIMTYNWDELDPETIFENGMKFYQDIFKDHVFLLSVHENEDGIFVHVLIRKVEGADWPYDNIEKYESYTKEQKDYLDAMRYLMY